MSVPIFTAPTFTCLLCDINQLGGTDMKPKVGMILGLHTVEAEVERPIRDIHGRTRFVFICQDCLRRLPLYITLKEAAPSLFEQEYQCEPPEPPTFKEKVLFELETLLTKAENRETHGDWDGANLQSGYIDGIHDARRAIGKLEE